MFLVGGLHCHVPASQTIYRHRSLALPATSKLRTSAQRWPNGFSHWACAQPISLDTSFSHPDKTRWPISVDCWSAVYDAGPTSNQLVFAGQDSLCLYSANIFRYQFCPPQQRHVDQCWFNNVPTSTTLAQHGTNIWSTSRVCWAGLSCSILESWWLGKPPAPPPTHTLFCVGLQ